MTRVRRFSGLIRLSSDAVTPLTHQLAETIRRLIIDGIWLKGDKLPGSRTIASDAHISRNTVNAALEILIAEGLLQSRGRSGVYVTWDHPSRLPRPQLEEARIAHTPKPFALDAMPHDLFPAAAWKRLQTRYLSKAGACEAAPQTGARELREAIATYANVSLGIACGVDQVVIVAGLRDALSLLRAQFHEREPVIWCEEPSDAATRFAVRAAGFNGASAPVDVQGLHVEAALQLAPSARAALVKPAYQFPTGAMLSPGRSKDLSDWSSQTGAIVIEDARDGEFVSSKRPQRPLVLTSPQSVVHFNVFGRTMSQHVGIGYLIVPAALAGAFQHAFRQVEMHIPLAMQCALAEFISSGQYAKHLRKLKEAVEARRSALLDALGAQLSGYLKIDQQHGGLHVCARLLDRASDVAIAEQARKLGLQVEALSAMFTQEPREHGLLFGYAGFDESAIAHAVHALARVFVAEAASAAG